MTDLYKFIDSYSSANETERKTRRKGSEGTNEFFTPASIVIKMMDKIPPEDWADPEKTFLEPSFGSGNFIIGILYRRIVDYNIDWHTALSTVWGVELMRDNVEETRERVLALLTQLGIDFDRDEAMKLMKKRLVQADFFKWDFEKWCEKS